MVFKVSWYQYLTNNELYDNLPKASDKTDKTKIIWTLCDTCIRDSIHLDFMKNITRRPNRGRK